MEKVIDNHLRCLKEDTLDLLDSLSALEEIVNLGLDIQKAQDGSLRPEKIFEVIDSLVSRGYVDVQYTIETTHLNADGKPVILSERKRWSESPPPCEGKHCNLSCFTVDSESRALFYNVMEKSFLHVISKWISLKNYKSSIEQLDDAVDIPVETTILLENTIDRILSMYAQLPEIRERVELRLELGGYSDSDFNGILRKKEELYSINKSTYPEFTE